SSAQSASSASVTSSAVPIGVSSRSSPNDRGAVIFAGFRTFKEPVPDSVSLAIPKPSRHPFCVACRPWRGAYAVSLSCGALILHCGKRSSTIRPNRGALQGGETSGQCNKNEHHKRNALQ